MFRILFTAALALGLAAGSAHAGGLESPAPDKAASGLLNSGVADLWIGHVSIEPDLSSPSDNPTDTGRAGGQLLFNLPLGNNASLQLDIAGEGDFDNNDPDGFTQDYEGLIQGGAHLSHRVPNSYLIGGFVGVGEVFVGSGSSGLNKDEGGWMAGAEGQLYHGNTTFYGQAGYFDSDGNDFETLVDAWFVRGVIRHFFTPNSMISGEVLYGEGEDSATPISEDINFAGWELIYKRQMDSRPVDWFVAYDGHYVENDKVPGLTDEDLVEHVFKIGFSIRFGGANSLLDQDRRGATLDLPFDPLRAAGYTVDVVD